jgi:hypothetical protein
MMRRFSGACLAALVIALSSTSCFAKPPDLPRDTKIVVSPQAPATQESLPLEPAVPESGEWRAFREGGQLNGEESESWNAALREMVTSSLFLEIHPFLAFWGQTGPTVPVSGPVSAETTSPCPYLQQQATKCEPARVLNPEALRSVMDNMRALEQVGKEMQKARRLADEGQFLEALECLEKVRPVCPGSSLEKEIEEAYQEFISAADAQMERTTEAAEEEDESDGSECCCCGWMSQFGMCWFSQFADWLTEKEGTSCRLNRVDCAMICADSFLSLLTGWHFVNVYSSDPNRRIIEMLNSSEDLGKIQQEWEHIWINDQPSHLAPTRIHGGISPECDAPAATESCGGSRCCCPLETLLQTPVSMSFTGESLSKVLDEITFTYGVPFVVDFHGLQRTGYIPLDEIPVHIKVDQVPMNCALAMLLGRYHLQAEPKGCVLTVTTASRKFASGSDKGSEEHCEESSSPKKCDSVCPKCEAMHAKYVKQAGVEEQVSGLMKACYLALGDGRFEKAADLAREAYALDPTRVEADPLVYKLHLLAEQSIQNAPAKCPCPKSQRPTSEPCEEKPACDDPGLSFKPCLPEVHGDVPEALDDILTGKDEPCDKAAEKPAKKRSFTIGFDLECWGVSTDEVVGLFSGNYRPLPLTEKGLHVSMGTNGIGVQGTVPCQGVNYTLYLRDGLFLVWMTPEK